MGCVFLSHNSLDKPFVRMIASDIKASGIDIWLDEMELTVGDSLVLKIAEAIGKADYVVAFLSPNSIKSRWVQKELSVATTLSINGNEIMVLPLLLGEIQNREIPIFLIDQLYADFRKSVQYDSAFRELLRRLKPGALPERVLNIDTFRKDQLVATAKTAAMHNWILEYIIGTLHEREDPSERYWSYIALGEIGGRDAEETIQAGLKEVNQLARLGAQEAWKYIGHSLDE
jgi:hypothetical protein